MGQFIRIYTKKIVKFILFFYASHFLYFASSVISNRLYLAQTMQKITQIGNIVPNAVFIAVGREKVLKQLYYNPSVSLQSVEVPRVEDFKQNITFEQKKDSLESVRGNIEPEKSFQSFQNVNVNSQDKKAEKRRSSIDPSMLIEARKRVSIDTSNSNHSELSKKTSSGHSMKTHSNDSMRSMSRMASIEEEQGQTQGRESIDRSTTSFSQADSRDSFGSIKRMMSIQEEKPPVRKSFINKRKSIFD